MHISTRVEFDIATGRVLTRAGYVYTGPVSWMKKGADSAKAAAAGAGAVGQSAQDTAKANTGVQTSARTTANPFATSLLPSKSGGLSPYAQAQYGQEKMQNAENASNGRALGLRALGQRGFNSIGAPSSIINTSNEGQNRADTGAYENAMQNTLGQGLAGLNYFGNQQQVYDPTKAYGAASNAYGTQANAAQVMNSSPTLAGDIMSGLGGLAGAAGSVMTGMGGMGARF